MTAVSSLPNESVAGRAIRRVLKNVPDVTLTESDPHLVIASAQPLPPSKRDSWWLGIGPIDPSETARKAAADLAGPFVLEKQNPLLDGITLAGIVWGGVQAVSADITPIITAGSSPLLSRLNGTRATAYLLNIDLVPATDEELHRRNARNGQIFGWSPPNPLFGGISSSKTIDQNVGVNEDHLSRSFPAFRTYVPGELDAANNVRAVAPHSEEC